MSISFWKPYLHTFICLFRAVTFDTMLSSTVFEGNAQFFKTQEELDIQTLNNSSRKEKPLIFAYILRFNKVYQNLHLITFIWGGI